jgi:hypothetical protein
MQQGQSPTNVITAGQLRHHAAIGFVHSGLGVQGLGNQLWQGLTGLGANQGHARLIT